MKKYIALVLSLIILGSLVGCGTPSLSEGETTGHDTSSASEETPEAFSFALTWNCYGVSSYDSATGTLVKTTDATYPEDYVTEYLLSPEEEKQICAMIEALDADSYPDVYNPHGDGVASIPPMTLILTVRMGETEKTIEAKNIAISYESDDPKGQAFLTTCQDIIHILTETAEWKALPEYERLYD